MILVLKKLTIKTIIHTKEVLKKFLQKYVKQFIGQEIHDTKNKKKIRHSWQGSPKNNF